jgi:hypothetical protein
MSWEPCNTVSEKESSMLVRVSGAPDGVIAFEAVGKITSDDYQSSLPRPA